MIKKTLTNETLQRLALHESFLTMLFASVKWGEKWDVSDILIYWWGVAFPHRELTEEDLNDNTIDSIRYALLMRGGIEHPILKETKRTQLIKQSIIFSEE